MTEPVKTRCGHSFCLSCIKRVLFKKRSASCPLCKENISKRSISKDDHMETYIDKFKRVVIATQLDTHFDSEYTLEGTFFASIFLIKINCRNIKSLSSYGFIVR